MANSDEQTQASPPPGEPAKKKASAFQLSQEPVTSGDSPPVALAPAPTVAEPPSSPPKTTLPDYEDLGSLPATYEEDNLFLVARDPRWLFAYWDFDWSKYPASSMRYGYAQFFLRVTRSNGGHEAQVEINVLARNWYVPVSQPDTAYLGEIGYFDQEGAWRVIVRSAVAQTPPDALAPETQPIDFATVPSQISFEQLLGMVQEKMSAGETLIAALSRIAGEGQVQFRAGEPPVWTDEQKRLLAALLGESLVDRVGLGSAEIDQLLRKTLQEKLYSESASGLSLGLLTELGPSTQSLFSAIGASWSAQPFSTRTERGFFMHVNAEIIFYGGTHPDATVTVQGNEIKLSADGTFRYHFTLPDGDFQIPIVATSPDKVEQRSATLSFQRGTERVGDVSSTGQPGELSSLIGRR